MWETWRRLPYTEPTYCAGSNTTPSRPWDSLNVMSISFGKGTERELNFKYTRDHCKWGISVDGDPSVALRGSGGGGHMVRGGAAVNSLVCVGDINRMTSQKKRGGGTACMRNPALWRAMRALVNSTDNCTEAGAATR